MSVADLDRWAGSMLELLWRSSWQAAVLALLVLAAQWTLRSRLSARWRHNLWLLVLLRLLVPVTPQSPLSVFNLYPQSDRTRVTTIATDHVDVAIPLAVSQASFANDVAHPQATPALSARTALLAHWKLILASLWLLGVLLLLSRILVATARLVRSTRRMTVVTDGAILDLLDRCCDELNVRRSVRLLASDDLAAPALMGVVRPQILLPRNVIDHFDPAELRLILLHELAHLRRHDIAINWVVAVLQALHWFNPILWLAFARLRSDRELACDEMVLLAAGDADHAKYGHTIVKLLQSLPKLPQQTHASVAPSQAAAVGILERAHPMRRRITMIAQFPRRAKQWTALAAVCMLALAGSGLTDAVRGEDAEAVADPAISPSDPAIAAAATSATTTRPAAAVAPTLPGATLEVQGGTLTFQGAATRDPSAISDAEKTYRELQRRVPEVRVDAIGMGDVIDYLRDVTDQNIVVNWRALEAAGIEKNVPIDLRLKNATLVQVLRQMGKVAGGQSIAMGFAIDGGSIVFTTAEDAMGQPRVRSYDVSDLVTTATTRPGAEGNMIALDTLKQAIQDNVMPDCWRDAGGSAAGLSIFGNKLLISAPDMVHLEVDELLAELRRK